MTYGQTSNVCTTTAALAPAASARSAFEANVQTPRSKTTKLKAATRIALSVRRGRQRDCAFHERLLMFAPGQLTLQSAQCSSTDRPHRRHPVVFVGCSPRLPTCDWEACNNFTTGVYQHMPAHDNTERHINITSATYLADHLRAAESPLMCTTHVAAHSVKLYRCTRLTVSRCGQVVPHCRTRTLEEPAPCQACCTSCCLRRHTPTSLARRLHSSGMYAP